MSFVFAPSPDAKTPNTTRKIHIRRLYDVLHICLQRNDVKRATRAWTILAHCKEMSWQTMWMTGVHILAENLDESEKTSERIEFLRVMMLQHPDDRENILKELVLRLIISKQYSEALDDLELYLPSVPYQDNPLLHLYAGLLSLYLAQPTSQHTTLTPASQFQFNPSGLRNAQTFLERAKSLDPMNPMTEAFLQKIQNLNGASARPDEESEKSDEEALEGLHDTPKRKRVRTASN
ncbi:hypothetical protein B0H16DRAFT_1496884 [Mycena metata]|uniref:Uncharacterized protein n=1 Tax=Mycena metata TaxID=1033252 RepID=A0AAD7K9D9_9AGAR|nr:hypothetical protein B0H16DRAFT_1496884 [Mycena metata]